MLFTLFVLLVFFLTYLLRDDTSVSKTPYYTTKTEESLNNAVTENGDQVTQGDEINEPDTTPKDGEKDTKSESDYNELKTLTSDAKSLSELMRRFNESYPWYSKLPIENDDYIILWDLEKEQFRIALKINESSSQEQKDGLMEDALIEIQKLAGWKPNQYEYYVVFLN